MKEPSEHSGRLFLLALSSGSGATAPGKANGERHPARTLKRCRTEDRMKKIQQDPDKYFFQNRILLNAKIESVFIQISFRFHSDPKIFFQKIKTEINNSRSKNLRGNSADQDPVSRFTRQKTPKKARFHVHTQSHT